MTSLPTTSSYFQRPNTRILHNACIIFLSCIPLSFFNLKGYVEHFTASMHKEYSSKGIHFQVQSPLFVTTKLAKIRKASLTVPTPKAFAASSVKAMGYELQTSPFWAHALQLAVMGALPSFVLDKVIE